MKSLHVICGLPPPPTKNPGYVYDLDCRILEQKLEESLNLEKLLFRSVKTSREKTESKIFRLESSFEYISV